MEFEVTFEKKMTYTASIEAKDYEAAEEKALKMIDDEEERSFKNCLKTGDDSSGWDLEAEFDCWEIADIVEDE